MNAKEYGFHRKTENFLILLIVQAKLRADLIKGLCTISTQDKMILLK